MESWLNSHIHTHKGMICECGLKIWLNAKFMFIVNGCLCASRSIQDFYHVLLCIENSTNYKSLLLTVSFYMLSLRWDFPEASWDLRIFNSSSLLSDPFLLTLNFCTTVQTCHPYVCPFSHTHPWDATALSKNSNPNSMQLSIFRLDAIEKYHRFALDLSFI